MTPESNADSAATPSSENADKVRRLIGNTFHPGGQKISGLLGQALRLERKSEVLDVACGGGETARTYATRFQCSVTGIDLSEEHQKEAERAAESHPYAANMDFLCCDVIDLPFEDNSFDALSCEFALSTFEEPEKALREMCRVLRPEGRLGITDVIVAPGLEELVKLTATGFAAVLNLVGARSTEDYATLMKDAGFDVIKASEMNWALIHMIDTIEEKLYVARSVGGTTTEHFPQWMKEASESLEIARGFIEANKIGYVMLTARKLR